MPIRCCRLYLDALTTQVEEFVVEAGADAQSVEVSLNRVRDVSWAAGRTFRGKHMVLLAFAEVSIVILRSPRLVPQGKELATIRLCS